MVSLKKKGEDMSLPQQIVERLDSLGISPADVEERFVRGSGPGGQKVNKTSSTVVLVHRPTGVEVRIQRERSQAANREIAWKELCNRFEQRRRAAVQAVVDQREKLRRANRPKSRGAKRRMTADKRHRAGIKSGRGRPSSD